MRADSLDLRERVLKDLDAGLKSSIVASEGLGPFGFDSAAQATANRHR